MDAFSWFAGLEKYVGNSVLAGLIKIGIVILIAVFLFFAGKHFIKRVVAKRQKKSPDRPGVGWSIALSVWKYGVIILAIIAVLEILGLGSTANSLIATAGVGGIAIGIGAQDSIKDILSGMTLIMEGQIKTGDFIKLDTCDGFVESMTLRTTHIRGINGELYMIPNGTIKTVVNYSRGTLSAVVNIKIAHESDAQKALRVMEDIALEYDKENDNIVGAPKILAITELDESGVNLRLSIPTESLAKWSVQNELLKRIKLAFEKEGIVIPYRTVTLDKH